VHHVQVRDSQSISGGVETGTEDDELAHSSPGGERQAVLGDPGLRADEPSHLATFVMRRGGQQQLGLGLSQHRYCERIGEYDPALGQLMCGAPAGRRNRIEAGRPSCSDATGGARRPRTRTGMVCFT